MLLTLLSLIACKNPATDTDTDVPVACEAGPVHTWRDNTVPPAIQSAFEAELEALDADGVAFAILVDGEVRFAGAAGIRDRQGQVPMLPDTLMRGGSTNKMQTSALVLDLEADGLLTRADTIEDHLPDFSMTSAPGVAEQATIHQLLTHQGGFFDYTPIDGPAGPNSLYNHAHDVFAAQPMLTEPGNFYNYSNPNFAMAGLIAQEAAGEPYAALMRERIWDPLCMTRTTFEAEEVIADGNFATARTFDWNGSGQQVRVEPDSYDQGFSRPAGFYWTSAIEMVHFAHFLLEGDEAVMPTSLSNELSAPQVDTRELPDGLEHYGYGIDRLEKFSSVTGWKQGPMLSHGGAIPGFAADLYLHPDSGVAIAVLSNTDGAYFTESVLTAMERVADLQATTAPELPPPVASDFVGTYQDPDNLGTVNLTVVDGELTVDAPRLDGAGISYGTVMEPLYGDNYYWELDGAGAQITFVRDQGESRWMRTRFFVADKEELTSTSAPALPAPPRLTDRPVGVLLKERR